MNAEFHARMSMKEAKATSDKDFDFFYRVHDFMDCSKEVESSNLHRIYLHSLWGIKRIMIPIFGHTYVTVEGEKVNLKDDLERNHVMIDFKGRFIPTLTDYVSLIEDDESDGQTFNEFRDKYKIFFKDPAFQDLMMSPLANTGLLKSLWITHNSWFVRQILPKVLGTEMFFHIEDERKFSPSIMFNRMKYDSWVQNGQDMPPSFVKIERYRKSKKSIFEISKPSIDKISDVVYDGSRRRSPELID